MDYSTGFHRLIPFLFLWLSSINLVAQNKTRPNIIGPDGLTVNSYTGSLFLQRTDVNIPGSGISLDMTFSYNGSSRKSNDGYGYGWTHPFNVHYRWQDEDPSNQDTILVTMEDGRNERYFVSPNAQSGKDYRAQAGVFKTLTEYEEGKFHLTTSDGRIYDFDNPEHRKVSSITDRNGNTISMSYVQGELRTITDAAGRSLSLVWENGRLKNLIDDIEDDDIRTFTYSYDGEGHLTSVKDPEDNVAGYFYGKDHTLVAIADKNGNTIDVSYDKNSAVTKIASCLSVQQIVYNGDLRKTYVVERTRDGDFRTAYAYDDQGNLTNKEGNCCGYNMSYEYDSDLNINQKTDANGNTYQYTYDQIGNVLSEIDPLGFTTSFTYDSKYSLITSITDKNGNKTTFDYDSKGNLLEVQYPEGVSEKFNNYDSYGNPQLYEDGKGNQTIYEYDDNGYLKKIINAEKEETEFEYDDRGNLRKETDPRDHVTEYTSYDGLNRLKEVKDAKGFITKYKYDAKGNQEEIIDALDRATKYEYDPLDRLYQTIDANKEVTTMLYDEQGNLIGRTDPNGNTTQYTYDERSRLTSETNPEGEATFYTYDNNGNILQIILPNGNTISNEYDKLNRLLSSRDNLGVIVSYAYDGNGNRLTETDGNGNTTQYKYDGLNRLTSVTDPLGQITRYTLDKNGNIDAMRDRNGHVTDYDYDKENRLIWEKDALGNITEYDHDPSGNQNYIKDANDNITTYEYDERNQLVLETYADETTVKYDYDAVGNLEKRTDQKGKTTTYKYDDLNRLTLRDYSEGNDDHFRYDAGGRMDSTWNNLASIQFTYDAANRILSETLNGKTTRYDYDVRGKRKTITYPGGKVVEEIMDNRDQISEIRQNGQILATFAYDAGDRIESKSYPLNGTSTSYSYDANNRLTNLNHNPGSFLNFSYQYDFEFNRKEAKALHDPAHSESFLYDNNDRLTQYQRGPPTSSGTQISFKYDDVGNRDIVVQNGVTTNYAPNNLNQYASITQEETTFSPEYDDNGNLTNDGSYSYQYNLENRLISVNNGSVAEYYYDPLGRRIQKKTSEGTIKYYFDGDRVIEERDASDNLIASYLYGTWIDDVLVMERNGALYFYHHNALGSVIGLTDATGNLIESYEFDPYGKVLNESSIGNPYLFTGRRLDTETGNYNYRVRYYDPDDGRFLQRDPIKFVDGINLYSYVQNNPQNFVDPLGTKKENSYSQRNQSNANNNQYCDAHCGGLPDVTDKFNRTLAITNRFFSEKRIEFDKRLKRSKKSALLPPDYVAIYSVFWTSKLSFFISQVRTGKRFDIKQEGKGYSKAELGGRACYNGQIFRSDDFGNYNFGVAARAFGIPLWLGKTGAGVYQVWSGTSDFSFYKSFFDDPRDTEYIIKGYNHEF